MCVPVGVLVLGEMRPGIDMTVAKGSLGLIRPVEGFRFERMTWLVFYEGVLPSTSMRHNISRIGVCL